ncbi:MAG: hypothetical protein AB1453_04865 [Chloroflexota bacterium]|jgi:hypothetical protein
MNDQKASFIPFNAINQFMLPDYRSRLVQEVFSKFSQLPESRQAAINRLVKRLVKVDGFRNSVAAPATLKARAAIAPFERSPELVAQMCSAWCELHPSLAIKVHDFLKSRGWEVLPVEADRAVLPGFLTRWLEKDTFEALDDAFSAENPADDTHEYDLNMMIVWISGRLPVDLVSASGSDEIE